MQQANFSETPKEGYPYGRARMMGGGQLMTFDWWQTRAECDTYSAERKKDLQTSVDFFTIYVPHLDKGITDTDRIEFIERTKRLPQFSAQQWENGPWPESFRRDTFREIIDNMKRSDFSHNWKLMESHIPVGGSIEVKLKCSDCGEEFTGDVVDSPITGCAKVHQ